MKKSLHFFTKQFVIVITFILTGLTAGAQCLSITCPPSMTTNVAPGLCGGTANFALPTYTNACVPSTTLTYSYTGAVQLFTVPAGVTTMTVILKGAQGANQTPGGTGGLGGTIEGQISVTPGQVLNLYVGGQNGYNGGGTGGVNGNSIGSGPTTGYAGNGGGASDIRLSGVALTDRIIVAGGGGGAAHDAVWPSCQPTSAVGNGGNGGGLTGGSGTQGASSSCNCQGGGGGGGAGGTASAGGAAGSYVGSSSCLRGSWTAGNAGIIGAGGNGATTYYNGSGGGGAGGGGYYGGGAGANGSDTTPGGGGGGGSSFAGSATNVVNTAGSNSGDGSIQLILPPVFLTQIGGLASGSTFTLGTTLQTFSVTDYINSNTCSFSVTVIDNITPTITCPANVNQCASAVPTISPLSVTDNCLNPTVTYTLTGATTGNGSNNASGTFNTGLTTVLYQATDASGNAGTCSFSVNIYPIPVISVNDATICSGNQAVITPSGASTYTVTGGNFTVSPTTNTSYSITGTSSNGCLSSNTAVSAIIVYATPTLSVNDATICSGNQAVITPSGAATYTVSGGNFTVAPVTNTSYSVTGTSVDGCVSSATAVVQVVVYTTPTVGVNSATICYASSVTLVPTGAATYTITGGNFTVDPTVTTDYSVTGVSADGCAASNTAIANVFVNETPTVSASGGAICNGASFVITPLGADTYTITGGNFTVNPTTTTTYSVTGTGTNGCVGLTETVLSVTVNTLPNVTANASSTICAGGTAVLSAAGAATYAWNNGLAGASVNVTPIVNTTYTVTGTDGNSCTNTAVVTQEVDPCTGINGITNNIGFSLYPNPNTGEFIIAVEQNTSLSVLNHLGQVIYTAELNPGKSTVDLTRYASGVYFVNLQQNNNMKSVKVIKQ